ncbi:serine/threonine-protein kinase Nek4-like [Xenia sp. Carnegie-2017]|uniref:serine/threonine-protein kinase Nek4-like n=1 Tax=Xenia sp. Carnegie-2017 TaxID=2897299 RepID=UPI001F04B74A|nr:serine/threonine-protein kinase Nek4-like [Xenia sp. Carnegie-2017]XP_046860482.1 serine/threonine-protein kinase Nek4-like [Xenia sp. Carnegie-2017]
MDNYEIISTIGRGASGKVFLVRSCKDHRQYAMKQIILNSKSNTKESVLKEARILSKLKHPHIVTCYEFFFDEREECLSIIQDYCDCGNLEDQIFLKKEKHKNIEEDQIMEWFVQILMAVQYIHSKKILHRDLKTQNVFLSKSNIIKIGDFGIARVMENTLDMAETCCGTPCYLSPELCQDLPYTSKADIWALGCLLYELCCLRPAFSAGNIVSLFYKIVSGEFEPLPSMYSEDLAKIISQMMLKSPEERPSAASILDAQYVKHYLSLFSDGKQNSKEQQRSSDEACRSSSQDQRPSILSHDEPSCPEYPHDFEASSSNDEREYSDDFDDTDESVKEPLAASEGDCSASKVCVKMESYSDEEFESDSESVQDVLTSALADQDLQVDEETVEDDDYHLTTRT